MSLLTSITIELIKFVEIIIIKMGLLGVFFLMLLEGMLLPVPSEVVMTFSGYLAFYGLLDPFGSYFSIILLLLAGSIVFISILFICLTLCSYSCSLEF